MVELIPTQGMDHNKHSFIKLRENIWRVMWWKRSPVKWNAEKRSNSPFWRWRHRIIPSHPIKHPCLSPTFFFFFKKKKPFVMCVSSCIPSDFFHHSITLHHSFWKFWIGVGSVSSKKIFPEFVQCIPESNVR